MNKFLNYPFDSAYLLRKKRSIRRELLINISMEEKRIAILGGSTTSEVKDMIELFLLNEGIKPIFYESEFNRYYEDVMFSNNILKEFSPDIIYIHTSNVNIGTYPSFADSYEQVESQFKEQTERFKNFWDKIVSEYSCAIIQNNFELPHYRLLGNLDVHDIHGRSLYISRLNSFMYNYANKTSNFYINDINYLSAWFGLEKWYDKFFWYSYKYAMNVEAMPFIAHSIVSIIKSIYGKAKKCLVLDLDHTLWGGVIGDDGLNGIKIGKETAEAEAFTAFQQYIKELKERGIILAVSSKNDEKNAMEGFSHPDSVLKKEDFSQFRANWEPKNQNIIQISEQLNIGLESLVFIDDNPFERDFIRSQESQVAVPEVGSDIVKFINILDKSGLFEPISLSNDDLKRSVFYKANSVRENVQRQFENYEDFLCSLNMKAEISSFCPIYLDRITQLINKTNQFNLTTKRYILSEVEAISTDDMFIKLYGRLEDKFGDNGLVSVIIGRIEKRRLHLDLWLMSCRVLKRDMEKAMLDQLVEEARKRNINEVIGYYYPTAKNGMVSSLFQVMGFEQLSDASTEGSLWKMNLSNYGRKNTIINIYNGNRKN
jgi:FkbH-like protein